MQITIYNGPDCKVDILIQFPQMLIISNETIMLFDSQIYMY